VVSSFNAVHISSTTFVVMFSNEYGIPLTQYNVEISKLTIQLNVLSISFICECDIPMINVLIFRLFIISESLGHVPSTSSFFVSVISNNALFSLLLNNFSPTSNTNDELEYSFSLKSFKLSMTVFNSFRLSYALN